MDVLQVQFRKHAEQWQVRLVPRCTGLAPHEWRNWNPPRQEYLERELLASLFNTDEARLLLNRPWHLQLRGEELGLSWTGIPMGHEWSYLVHPASGCHLLDVGWTVTELTVEPLDATFSGTIAVLGNASLVAELRRSVSPIVQEATAETLPEQAVVVVAGEGMDGKMAKEIDDEACRRHCPLLIWCSFAPPRGHVPAILDLVSPAPKGWEQWLSRLLVRLLRGQEPALAFADAGASDPPKDRFLRRMRGAYKEWKVTGELPSLTLPRDWYIRLDRSEQEGELNTLVDGLVAARARRIQVIFSPGPEGSGLDLFRQRPLRYSGPRKVVEWDLGWSDNPAHTIQELQRRVRATRPTNLAHRLQEEAARNEHGTLFLLRHSTVSLERRPDAIQVTPAELRQYCSDLQSLANDLGTTNIRLLLHISVAGATTQQLADLYTTSHPHYMADVLKTLDAGVPRGELERWLRAHDLRFDKADLDLMQGMTYDDLIQWIVQRQPNLVGC
jgi:hypothetical protein